MQYPISYLQVICSLCSCQVDVQHVINIKEVCFYSPAYHENGFHIMIYTVDHRVVTVQICPDDKCVTQLTFMKQYYFLLIFSLICFCFCDFQSSISEL